MTCDPCMLLPRMIDSSWKISYSNGQRSKRETMVITQPRAFAKIVRHLIMLIRPDWKLISSAHTSGVAYQCCYLFGRVELG